MKEKKKIRVQRTWMNCSCGTALFFNPEELVSWNLWSILMSDRAFLLVWEVPSVVSEYSSGMSEGWFLARSDIASPPQFMHKYSRIETQYSFRPREVEDCRVDITIGRGDVWRIETDPSTLSANVARTANESVTRSSTFEEARMLTRIGTNPAESTL